MAGLDTYRAKRDFTATPEPKGRARKGTKAAASGAYVIQKHAARRLHYDLRLEMDGVLKSWAVTRGPSLVPGEKRLAVHVEDHPLDYGSFEGTIPEGHYGAGNVIVWDRGTWTAVADAAKGYKKGHLEFTLQGEKLTGRWHLVRMAPRPGDKADNWLLIKAEDEVARAPDAPDIIVEAPLSVVSGRDVETLSAAPPAQKRKRRASPAAAKESAAPKVTAQAKPAAKPTAQPASTRKSARTPRAAATAADAPLSAALPKGAKRAPLPDFIPPALATLARHAPKGGRYLHEIKFDGYRIEARIEKQTCRLLTRTGLDWSARFGETVRGALAALDVTDAVIDGEIVVEGQGGASDFSALQGDLSEGRTDRFVYYAFDLLHLDGHDLTALTLSARKDLLARLLAGAPAPEGGPLRYSAHFEDDGALVLRHACRLSLEGIVSKLKDAPYRSGRSKDWIKSKCSERQEFVIGGYVPSTTARRAIGSLALGVHEKGKLVHVGRVGTGFSNRVAADLFALLDQDRSDESPFAAKLTAEEARGLVFVAPRHVAEVEFRAWTGDGHLRHASFRGLRDDKAAEDVVRETAAAPAPAAPPKRRVALTHPDRVYWPQAGVTKEGLADYYAEVWRFIAPYVVGRPLALVRCPEGINGPHFFQKHPWKGAHSAIRTVPDPKEPSEAPYLAIDSLDGLMGLVQGGVLEIHPFGAPLSDWERPDMVVMDLDPGDGVGWEAVIAAAQEVKARLERHGLIAFVKTSGGKGLHVCAPLTPKADWSALKAFTKTMAEELAADDPKRFVATISKAKRRGRILVDYLRNQRGATAVAAYSTRAREGAPVSMPLSWDELSPQIGPAHFTVLNAPTRLANLSADPWADFRKAAAPLPTGGTAVRRRR